MAEVTQYTRASQEDQLKAIASCSPVLHRKGENREWFILPRPQGKEWQWQGMGLIWFLSSPARAFLNEAKSMINSIHTSKSEPFFCLSQTLLLRQEKVGWPSGHTFSLLHSIWSQHFVPGHIFGFQGPSQPWFHPRVPSAEKWADEGW